MNMPLYILKIYIIKYHVNAEYIIIHQPLFYLQIANITMRDLIFT